MAAERTLVLIKPDAMRRGLAGEIVRRFEARGLELRDAIYQKKWIAMRQDVLDDGVIQWEIQRIHR